MHRLAFSALPLIAGLAAGGSLEVRDQVALEGIERVKVRWTGGAVRVLAGGSDRVEARSLAWGPQAPVAFSARRDGEILALELACSLPVPCGGELDLALPAGVRVELELGEGDVEIRGPVGDSSVLVDSGSIRADGLVAREVVLQVVDGSIRAAWEEAPERVVLASVTGDVELALPDAVYRVEDRLGRAELRGIRSDPAAERCVELTLVEGTAHLRAVDGELASLR